MSSQLPADPPTVSLPLSADEALVLFEFLTRAVDHRNGVELLPVMEHEAELWALLRVQGLLESRLAEPFRADYRALVESARARLVDALGPWPQ